MSNNKKALTPELLFQDDAKIATIQPNLEIAKSTLQAAIDAYNAIDGLEPLNDLLIANWISDPDSEIEAQHQYFYNQKFAESHTQIGIGQEKGMGLVADKLPDLTQVKEAFSQYASLGAKFYKSQSVDIPFSTFHYEDGTLSVNDHALNQMTANHQFHLEYPLEFQYRDQLKNIMDAINALDEIGAKIHPTLRPFDSNQLISDHQVRLNIPTLFSGYKKDHLGHICQKSFELDINFFRQLKETLKELGKTGVQ